MKSKIWLLIAILIFACKNNKSTELVIPENNNKEESKTVVVKKDFNQLPKYLIMLTKIEEQWVVFNPCNASNGEIKIDGNKLIWAEGHEAEELFIKSIEDLVHGHLLDIESFGKLYKRGIEIMVDDKQQLFTFRNKLYGGDNTRVFVAKDRVSNYKVIEQPCKECWDDCD